MKNALGCVKMGPQHRDSCVSYLTQGYMHHRCQVVATFFMVVPNICGSSVCSMESTSCQPSTI